MFLLSPFLFLTFHSHTKCDLTFMSQDINEQYNNRTDVILGMLIILISSIWYFGLTRDDSTTALNGATVGIEPGSEVGSVCG